MSNNTVKTRVIRANRLLPAGRCTEQRLEGGLILHFLSPFPPDKRSSPGGGERDSLVRRLEAREGRGRRNGCSEAVSHTVCFCLLTLVGVTVGHELVFSSRALPVGILGPGMQAASFWERCYRCSVRPGTWVSGSPSLAASPGSAGQNI